jgi:hypothetical protein
MTKTRTTIRKLLLALTLAVGAGGVMAGPALAADWGHGQYGWEHGRVWHGRGYVDLGFAPAPVYVAPAYGYGYAAPPPPVVYAPPVAALNFVIPLHIR